MCVLFVTCCAVLHGVRVLCAVCVRVRVLALCVLCVMYSMMLDRLLCCACVLCECVHVWFYVNVCVVCVVSCAAVWFVFVVFFWGLNRGCVCLCFYR